MKLILFKDHVIKLFGLGLSALAAYFAFTLSVIHLNGTQTCPVIFDLPACIIVFICYVLITIAWGMLLVKKQKTWRKIIFTIGYIPAILLAVIGSSGEIIGFVHCPTTENGFPKCFISLAFLIILGIGWKISNYPQKHGINV